MSADWCLSQQQKVRESIKNWFQSIYPNLSWLQYGVFCLVYKGVRKGGFGVKPPPLELDILQKLITFAKRLIVFAYFLLVNLST